VSIVKKINKPRRPASDVVISTRVQKPVARFIRGEAQRDGLTRASWVRRELIRRARGE